MLGIAAICDEVIRASAAIYANIAVLRADRLAWCTGRQVFATPNA